MTTDGSPRSYTAVGVDAGPMAGHAGHAVRGMRLTETPAAMLRFLDATRR